MIGCSLIIDNTYYYHLHKPYLFVSSSICVTVVLLNPISLHQAIHEFVCVPKGKHFNTGKHQEQQDLVNHQELHLLQRKIVLSFDDFLAECFGFCKTHTIFHDCLAYVPCQICKLCTMPPTVQSAQVFSCTILISDVQFCTWI